MAARRQATRRVGRTRPGGTWARATEVGTGVAINTKVLLGAFTLSNPGIDEVIRRTRGVFVMDANVSGQALFGAVGLCIVSDAAAAAGAASIPGPLTEASDDIWFLHHFLAQARDEASGPVMLDSKAMRRGSEGTSIAWMFENSGVATVTVYAGLAIYATRR